MSVAVNRLLREPGESLRHRAFGAAVARELDLTYGQLSAAFARLVGNKTLAAYILSQRLAYAQELLSSSLSVGLIARRLGYASLAHFSGQFRRLARCSPSAYRRQLRAEMAPVVGEEAPNHAREGD
ncbi:helix-turn-helix domain-containing protein [Hymenobacter psychrotolerans]|uniref:AraC-type DNA-binding protein n=1 Tax=Hymenobacter psychrotolerans DSM 18569 TaxID=1121959 RepID=A0A1M7HVF1_9BACT|nr:AraC family transcriptional regulator [Hymenobacter psychrotolerans]SHM32541.1 AraC-type DNA-binding protein [Hymenobacter psychrotolerans DSM 18569]